MAVTNVGALIVPFPAGTVEQGASCITIQLSPPEVNDMWTLHGCFH